MIKISFVFFPSEQIKLINTRGENIYSKASFSTRTNVVRVLTKESVQLSYDHPTLDYMCAERALIQCDVHTRSIKLRIMMAHYLCLAHQVSLKTSDMHEIVFDAKKK